VCLLDAYVHVFFEPERLARFRRLVAEAGRDRDLDWLSLDPLVPLGPSARRTVVDVDAPAAILQRGRDGGVFGILSRRAFRDGRDRAWLLALGHPGGAWLEWLSDDG
jgi:alkanesulfonate monooxygenase SsuD/methylene tetrahydromethanopterin reductase-like flavin-dependent oxidoreductase (luciferase family)